MSKRSKACDIMKKVKNIVWQRDNQRCIICKNPNAMPNAHYISRAQGGLGIEQNVVTLCMKCHHDYDNGLKREENKKLIKEYLESQYNDWNETSLIYKKY